VFVRLVGARLLCNNLAPRTNAHTLAECLPARRERILYYFDARSLSRQWIFAFSIDVACQWLWAAKLKAEAFPFIGKQSERKNK
jgi:hypothetical protein